MSKGFDWLGELIESPPVRALTEALRAGDDAVVDGSRGSSTNLLAGAIAAATGRPVLLVVAHLDEADDALDDLELFEEASHFHAGLRAERFGALEVLPGESGVSLELLAERLGVVSQIVEEQLPEVLVAPVQALMQSVPEPEALGAFSMSLHAGLVLPPHALIDWLTEAGYTRQDAIDQPGDFAVRGGIIDLFPPATTSDRAADTPGASSGGPIRLDYFGDEIESIHAIDPDTLGSGRRLDQPIRIVGASADTIQSDTRTTHLLDLLPDETIVVLHEVLELTEQARGYYERLTQATGIASPNAVFHRLTGRQHVRVNAYAAPGDSTDADASTIGLPLAPLQAFDTDAKSALHELGELARDGSSRVIVLCRKPAERDRLIELLGEHVPGAETSIDVQVRGLHRGFVWGQGAEGPRGQGVKGQTSGTEYLAPQPLNASTPCIHLVPHHELFHRYETRRRVRKITAGASGEQASDAFLDLDVGDHVVHVDHGIARFTGLKTMRRQGASQEYLTLEFAEKALLHVPATQIDLIQKYIGGFQGRPPLSKLGGKSWSKQKQNVAEAVRDLAKHLLQVQAARETVPGLRYPADTLWQKEFEAEFPYDETEDQLAAIAAIKRDMTSDRPMDRLICGDVGFGKTEVAIRAAFKAAEFGKQVAVLVPTTVLAEQHERTFRGRMADYPFRVESLSRFKTAAEQGKVLRELAAGQVDIIIGTHRILSQDVAFSDLGLVIVDEEQRFGVEHKNKLLEYRLTADVLTLTATPIPRTLHMAMIGLRDISSLSTAPVDRRAIVTEVVPFDNGRIKQAIIRELNREGQIYFVHNRVYNIQSVADDIKRLVPDARVIIGHGQMPPRELEKVMLTFMRGEADILVSTTIIESGIDIPSANTMFINQADHFGLAELHQLRGRVGRSRHRAYCYLLLPADRPINEVATKRLRAIEQYSMLGAGFKIAMRDLEIRGAGNLLGAEQSGHIAAVGYEMYCLLLEQETRRLRHEPIIEPAKTHLEIELTDPSPSLPKRYIKSDKHRMEAYRRLSRAATLDELEGVVGDLRDAYGDAPPTATALFDVTEIRIAASTLKIDRLKLEGPDLIFTTHAAAKLDHVFTNAPGRVTVVDAKTIYYRPPANYLSPQSTLLAVLRKLLVRRVASAEPRM